ALTLGGRRIADRRLLIQGTRAAVPPPVGGPEVHVAYAELHCRSYFSFLAGASSPEALVERAAELGYAALAVTDVDGAHGAPRAHLEARARGLRFAPGAE